MYLFERLPTNYKPQITNKPQKDNEQKKQTAKRQNFKYIQSICAIREAACFCFEF